VTLTLGGFGALESVFRTQILKRHISTLEFPP
jgi:hypothetical protein